MNVIKRVVFHMVKIKKEEDEKIIYEYFAINENNSLVMSVES